MKVLFDCHLPFQLAHGGAQIQIEQTANCLKEIGVEVEPMRWWDDTQTSDIVHFFARPHALYAHLVKKSGRKLVISELLTAQSSWTALRRLPNRVFCALNRFSGRRFDRRFNLEAYQSADAILTLTPWETKLVSELYDAPPEKVRLVSNGVEDVFFKRIPGEKKGDYLVCTATIAERKRVVELSEAAVIGRVPIWIIGKPYSESDQYYQKFLKIQQSHPDIIRYGGAISDRRELSKIYRESRGFVLLSSMESLSLSALEAAAAGCPLLLSDLPWARCSFENTVSYCSISNPPHKTAEILNAFYEGSSTLKIPARPKTWMEIAEEIKSIYKEILKN